MSKSVSAPRSVQLNYTHKEAYFCTLLRASSFANICGFMWDVLESAAPTYENMEISGICLACNTWKSTCKILTASLTRSGNQNKLDDLDFSFLSNISFITYNSKKFFFSFHFFCSLAVYKMFYATRHKWKESLWIIQHYPERCLGNVLLYIFWTDFML